MSAISLFSSSFCRAVPVALEVVASTGYEIVGDREIVADASRISGIAAEKICKAFVAKTSVFNKFTREKERSVACLKLAATRRLAGDNLILNGFCSQLVPAGISHLLRVALIADADFRLARVLDSGVPDPGEARRQLRSDDENCSAWIDFLGGDRGQGCWDSERYDLFIPMHKASVVQASAWIEENLWNPALTPSAASHRAIADLLLAAEIEAGLALAGHHVGVAATAGAVTLTLHQQVLMRGRLEEELTTLAQGFQGVASVAVTVGQGGRETGIYRKHDGEVPSRVLLVDDERELVKTLSERLQMRDMGSAVAYDGASALQLVQEDDPEVMIIDLKMPGIDGMEVLRRVKKTRPEIEVIVLTGKGSAEDRACCMDLGAFGFLEKPVDIEALSILLKKAHAKTRQRSQNKRSDNGHSA